MSDTPRTDAKIFNAPFLDSTMRSNPREAVIASFARQLERELNASKQAPTDNDTWNSLLESRARLERELRESLAREAQLRAFVASLPFAKWQYIESGEMSIDASKLLTLPVPPVVPVEDVKLLVEALTKIVQERFYPMSKRLKTDAGIAQDALSTFTAKHKL